MSYKKPVIGNFGRKLQVPWPGCHKFDGVLKIFKDGDSVKFVFFVWSDVWSCLKWRLLLRRWTDKKGLEEEFDEGDALDAAEKWFIGPCCKLMSDNWCLKNDTMQIDVWRSLIKIGRQAGRRACKQTIQGRTTNNPSLPNSPFQFFYFTFLKF